MWLDLRGTDGDPQTSPNPPILEIVALAKNSPLDPCALGSIVVPKVDGTQV